MSRGNEEVEGPYGHMAWRPVVVSMMLAPRQVLLPRPCGPLLPRRCRGKLPHAESGSQRCVASRVQRNSMGHCGVVGTLRLEAFVVLRCQHEHGWAGEFA